MTATGTVTAAPSVAVGDMFVSVWGYDQTNIDFARVVALTPKGVKIQAWKSKVVRDNGPQTYVVPGDGPATGRWIRTPEGSVYDRDAEAPIETKRLQVSGYDGKPYLARNTFSAWSLWDGRPEQETSSGFGH